MYKIVSLVDVSPPLTNGCMFVCFAAPSYHHQLFSCSLVDPIHHRDNLPAVEVTLMMVTSEPGTMVLVPPRMVMKEGDSLSFSLTSLSLSRTRSCNVTGNHPAAESYLWACYFLASFRLLFSRNLRKHSVLLLLHGQVAKMTPGQR